MKRWVACSLLLVLAACGGAPGQPVATADAQRGAQAGIDAASTAEAAEASAPAAVAQAEDADAPPDRAPTEPVETAALKAEPTEPEIPVDDDPNQFMTVREAGLREVLGEPALIRRDGTAEVWQFRGDACTLDLFLYPADGTAAAGGALAVKHIELRGEETLDERRACLARMIRARIVAADG